MVRNVLGWSAVSAGQVGRGVPQDTAVSWSPASSHPTTAQATPGAQDRPTFILSVPVAPFSGWRVTAPGPCVKEGRGPTPLLEEQALP